jgi:hypothetical protein
MDSLQLKLKLLKLNSIEAQYRSIQLNYLCYNFAKAMEAWLTKQIGAGWLEKFVWGLAVAGQGIGALLGCLLSPLCLRRFGFVSFHCRTARRVLVLQAGRGR